MKFHLLQDRGEHGVVVVDKFNISVDKNTDRKSKKRDDKVVCQHANLLSSVAGFWSVSLLLSLQLSLSLSFSLALSIKLSFSVIYSQVGKIRG